MSKEIRCRRCNKTVEVEDDYPFKTCEICRTRDRADRRVKSEVKKSDKKLVKDLKVDRSRMPEIFWSYKNFCIARSRFMHTKPSYEEYKQEVERWVKGQIEMEADLKIAMEKRRKLAESDPWERPNFLGRGRDKMGEALERVERGMTTIDPELVREAMEAPARPVPDSEMSESDKRIQRFFREQLAQDKDSNQETEDSEDLEEKTEENENNEN
ncbi:MAG: hypothetical protein NWE85_00335 [Candidatus Bathyarchaeota archaeon]|nr:hypothetical protein [Candidatus Bathyarchaeota archaeon]